jgi:hypothetical protein
LHAIEAGEEVCLSYTGDIIGVMSVPQRRRVLWLQKGFVCQCPGCMCEDDVSRHLNCPHCSDASCELYCRTMSNLIDAEDWQWQTRSCGASVVTSSDLSFAARLQREAQLSAEVASRFFTFDAEHAQEEARKFEETAAKIQNVEDDAGSTVPPDANLRTLSYKQLYNACVHTLGPAHFTALCTHAMLLCIEGFCLLQYQSRARLVWQERTKVWFAKIQKAQSSLEVVHKHAHMHSHTLSYFHLLTHKNIH